MALITTKSTKLPIAAKLVMGTNIITQSTGNPNVPGNEAALAAFAEAQEQLTSANMAEVETRGSLAEKMSAREQAVANWIEKRNALAGFTTSVTGGDPAKILSAGFGVRAPRTPTQRMPKPEKIVATLTGKPGYTHLDWPPLRGAKCYLMERCADPTTPDGWVLTLTCTASSADVNGAEPGQRCWYRVAAVNGKGQGPWSEPVCRPVM